jgi:hypothetical protein
MQFKVGDKVSYTFSQGMAARGRVVYGPYSLAGTGDLMCLVEWSDGEFKGEASSVMAEKLQPAPTFEVGQKVKFPYSPKQYEVVSGPYPTSDETVVFWVIKDRGGAHDTSFEKHMAPVVE